jgi:ribosomal-protein-alanine N-acetyltransferase
MNALPRPALAYRPMATDDLDSVLAIEQRIYPFPWSRGNFADSLQAGYRCTVMECDAQVMGYAILTLGAGEAHLLNLSVDAAWQGKGFGSALLRQQIDLARRGEARIMLLEVRPSNQVARALYRRFGFDQLTVRRGYYPDSKGREDALLLALRL